ncbi:MAG: BON domain-containing protein [bacterium]|nr:BON domain-containing protein [bacterium]
MRTATLATLILTLLLLSACDMAKGWGVEKGVIEALAKDPRTAAYTFAVSAAENGAVTITGEVGVIEELDIITEIAKGVKGVTSVVNNCTYPEPSSGMMQDYVTPGIGGGLL